MNMKPAIFIFLTIIVMTSAKSLVQSQIIGMSIDKMDKEGTNQHSVLKIRDAAKLITNDIANTARNIILLPARLTMLLVNRPNRPNRPMRFLRPLLSVLNGQSLSNSIPAAQEPATSSVQSTTSTPVVGPIIIPIAGTM
ncbi:uncharacterized protein LOC128388303 [Panonychus citri]|uniref:uncharacterized protein LOC128388303 n=1 Tax=Panonychus citri TaxID=50023 RepID=UPI0023071331|nr:uncharacterized protein LOC128388303 [Panonychus citri]